MRNFVRALAVVLVCAATSAVAQDFSQTIYFGDSNTDSGFFKYAPGNTVVPGGGKFTTNPGPVWSEILSNYFGKSADPANAPGGGTNYAAGGAQTDVFVPNVSGTAGAPSTATQIANYLASVGGKADPNALYTFYVGVNDMRAAQNLLPNVPAAQAYVDQHVADAIAQVRQLQA